MTGNTAGKEKHVNGEQTVRCPVEGGEAETLARGLHLHVMRSVGDGHGPQNEIPDDINLDAAEAVGTESVEMDYPETHETESVHRLCPYCERPFEGKQGVMIHLGQTAGRKNHPENPKELHDATEFAIVHVDENDNVVELLEEGDQTAMPSTQRRRESSQKDGVEPESIRAHVEHLRERGLDEEAARAEKLLLGE